jgi:probable addiction module antidote protein
LIDFKENFTKRLKNNSQELEEYKKYVFEMFEKDQNKELLLEGLKTIALSTQGISAAAKSSKLQRRSLYKILTKDGNPTLNNFFMILKSLNLKLKIAAL